jgi:hypothetical protein
MHIEAGDAGAGTRRVLYKIDVFDVRLAIVVRHGLTKNENRLRLLRPVFEAILERRHVGFRRQHVVAVAKPQSVTINRASQFLFMG